MGLQLPAGVTLAGDRGSHGAAGPLLFCNTLPDQRGLLSAGTDARLTGLRIRGPEPAIAEIGEYRRTSTMGMSTSTNVEVDNCEISHFNHSGVNIRGKNVRVHHCFIHDVHAYPIVVGHKAELPTLVAYYNEYAADGFVIIGINDGEEQQVVEDYVGTKGFVFPIWLDPNWLSERAFNTTNLPSSFVIDRTGQVRLQWVGAISRAMLDKYVLPIIME